MKIKKILLNNIALKLLALVLALMTWVYVGELNEDDSSKTFVQRFLSSSYLVSKKLYVQLNFTGELPKGYKLMQDDLKVTPAYIVVVGPSKVLANKEYIFTKPIDLGEYTKTNTLEIGLENISRTIKVEKTNVEVFVPVKKTGEREVVE